MARSVAVKGISFFSLVVGGEWAVASAGEVVVCEWRRCNCCVLRCFRVRLLILIAVSGSRRLGLVLVHWTASREIAIMSMATDAQIVFVLLDGRLRTESTTLWA